MHAGSARPFKNEKEISLDLEPHSAELARSNKGFSIVGGPADEQTVHVIL